MLNGWHGGGSCRRKAAAGVASRQRRAAGRRENGAARSDDDVRAPFMDLEPFIVSFALGEVAVEDGDALFTF